MAHRFVLAIDAGTSRVHCLIADLHGRPVSLSYRTWSYETPPDIAPLGREFDTGKFWATICQAIKQAIDNGGVAAGNIVGVSATSQREGVVFLDKQGNTLFAGPNIDLRALMQGLAIDGEYGQEIFGITGHKPSFMFVPAKLRWLQENRPELLERVDTVLAVCDWVVFKLTDERRGEISAASELGLVDIKARSWSGRLQRLLSLPQGIYPPLGTAGSLAGRVTSRAAKETGLQEGTPVALGGADTQCGLLGMGVIGGGEVGMVSGWSAPVQMVTDTAVFDKDSRVWTSCHAYPGKWVLESNAGEAGNAYRWLKDIMFGGNGLSEEKAYSAMDDLATKVSDGDGGVMAFLGPSAMDMSRLGLKIGGFVIPVPLSAGEVGRAHLVKAVLDNVCFAARANCMQIEAISGLKVGQLAIGGGLAKSRYLVKTLPSVLNVPVSVPAVKEVSTLGAAMAAGAGAGVYGTLRESVEAMKPEMEVIEPDVLRSAEYSDYYERWQSTGKWLDRLSEEIR